jgi:hypothetical protein
MLRVDETQALCRERSACAENVLQAASFTLDHEQPASSFLYHHKAACGEEEATQASARDSSFLRSSISHQGAETHALAHRSDYTNLRVQDHLAAAGNPQSDQLRLSVDVAEKAILGRPFKLTVCMRQTCL